MSETQHSSYRWVIVILAGLATFPMLAGMTSFPIAAQQLGAFTAEQIAGADGFLGYYWGVWIGFGLASFIISAVGLKRTLMVGLCCAAVPQLIIPFCGDPSLLKILRFIQGTCSMNVPVLFAFVAGSGWFPAKEASLATGIFLGMINCGSPFGDFVAKRMLEGKATFLGLGLFTVALLIACAMFMRVNSAGLTAAASSNDAQAFKTERKSIFAYKATWLLPLLFVPMCVPYWGIPVVWPLYAKFLQFGPNPMSTVQLWVGLVGFLAIFGGVVSDGILRKTGDVVAARINCIKYFMLLAFAGMLVTYFVSSLAPLVVTMLIAGFCYAGIAIFWALPPLVYPPDPDLNGKVSSLLTFVGNSPIVFVGPLFLWLSEKLGGWPPVFVACAVVATVVLLPVLYLLGKEIKGGSCQEPKAVRSSDELGIVRQ